MNGKCPSETEMPEGEDKNLQNSTSAFLEPKQLEIYKGLRSIGPEISAFYLDGVKIFSSADLETKSYLLAHIAREIECGLRDVLSYKEDEKEEQDRLGNEFKHLTSIAVAVGMSPDDPFVKRWFRVARTFHKYAHRHGAMRTPRKKEEFEKLWKEFENILFDLLGTYYNLLDRIDRILKYETPTKEILDTLPNLLEIDARRSYFFRNLKSPHWLKPLQERGYFAPENNPPPQNVPNQPGYFRVPYWSALDYLENVASKNNENPSEEVTNLVIEIIDSIINYRNEKGERIDNYRTDWKLMRIICLLPLEKIENKHIEFIGLALKTKSSVSLVAVDIDNTLFPKLLKDKAIALIIKLLDVIFEYQKTDMGIREYKSVMEEYWLGEILRKHKTEIAKLCGPEAAEIALNKIRTLTKEDKFQFSNAHIRTIEESSQSLFPDRFEYQLVYFVRDMYELSDSNKIRDKMIALTKEEHPIFKRIAIHVVNHHYKDLNALFWGWQGNPFNEGSLKHELYELLKANSTSFIEAEIEKVLNWIESKDYYIPDKIEDEGQKGRILAYQKKEWLSALLETNNVTVINSYKKYQEINPEKIDHPGFDSWIEVSFGLTSSMDTTIFVEKTNAEIAEYLNSYRKKNDVESMFQTDLSDAFRAFCVSKPEQFSVDLEPFLSVHLIYQHALLHGLGEAWRSKRTFPWDNLIEFMSGIVESEDFWNDQTSSKRTYRNWIISEIAWLLYEGTRDDGHAFDVKLFPIAEKILLTLAEKTKSDLAEMSDLATAVLNSPKGSVFLAMISYSLRCARLFKKDQENRWVESIKIDFNKRLDRKIEPSIEFSVVLGEYLVNLCYLDKKWVIENINRIFTKDDEDHWRAAFTGYITHCMTIYKDLYCLMRENGHYAKALSVDFTDRNVVKGITGHICVGYMEEWEKLDDTASLICRLIENGNAERLSEIVHFFWMLRNKLTPKIKAKVKPLWNKLFKRLWQNKEALEYREIISDLSTWLSLIDEIDEEIFEYLKLSARHIQTKMNEHFFIEHLLKHVTTEPRKVSEIYLEMLGAGVYPDFRQENIEKIVQILYDHGQKENAGKICNMYGEKGFDFLRGIYQRYKTDISVKQV